MASTIHEIPEIQTLASRGAWVRIPPETDVPITHRVRQIIDSPEFRRLARISQLGLVSLVYPAAHHSRFEHSLGVYRIALEYLEHLAHDPRFASLITAHDAEVFLVAALVHDLGHSPFCHPIEDIQLASVPRHELFANSFLLEGEIADTLRHQWHIQPREVVALLSETPRDTKSQILASMLSGPIDVDKMDYLHRDSLHAGVPYGRNFDRRRLIGSLCLNEAGNGLAITDKGRTAAEMMVFARYVMFSEVYWHHAVRAATAMLQRAFYLLHGDLELDRLFRLTESEWTRALFEVSRGGPAGELLDGLFGTRRQLYKRMGQYSVYQHRELYERLARRPYPWLAACAEHLADILSHHLSRRVAPHEVLIDAPPAKREVEFKVEVFFHKEDCYRTMGDVSPVVRTLAREQFDDYVKRVRVFVHPRVAKEMESQGDSEPLLEKAIEQTL